MRTHCSSELFLCVLVTMGYPYLDEQPSRGRVVLDIHGRHGSHARVTGRLGWIRQIANAAHVLVFPWFPPFFEFF